MLTGDGKLFSTFLDNFYKRNSSNIPSLFQRQHIRTSFTQFQSNCVTILKTTLENLNDPGMADHIIPVGR